MIAFDAEKKKRKKIKKKGVFLVQKILKRKLNYVKIHLNKKWYYEIITHMFVNEEYSRVWNEKVVTVPQRKQEEPWKQRQKWIYRQSKYSRSSHHTKQAYIEHLDLHTKLEPQPLKILVSAH